MQLGCKIKPQLAEFRFTVFQDLNFTFSPEARAYHWLLAVLADQCGDSRQCEA